MFEVLLAAKNDDRFGDFVNCWAKIFNISQEVIVRDFDKMKGEILIGVDTIWLRIVKTSKINLL